MSLLDIEILHTFKLFQWIKKTFDIIPADVGNIDTIRSSSAVRSVSMENVWFGISFPNEERNVGWDQQFKIILQGRSSDILFNACFAMIT